MSNEMQGAPQPSTLLDRSDVRVKHATGIGGAVAAFVERVRSGDLGSLPVVAGLIIIWTVFTSLNPVFLSADNLVNLLFDCSTVGVISLGIVCVLMVGQIDLSVGSMSGFASALVGMLWVNHGWPVLLAIVFERLQAGRLRTALIASFLLLLLLLSDSAAGRCQTQDPAPPPQPQSCSDLSAFRAAPLQVVLDRADAVRSCCETLLTRR